MLMGVNTGSLSGVAFLPSRSGGTRNASMRQSGSMDRPTVRPATIALTAAALCLPGSAWAQATEAHADTGDTAWMLISAALVLLMTPGLAPFYGGMVRRKNVLATLMY